MMKRILFVCVENSCRSQMAEAFARIYGKEKTDVNSAGSKTFSRNSEFFNSALSRRNVCRKRS